jgi:hypothetical protein
MALSRVPARRAVAFSTGKRGFDTPRGSYKVSWLDEHHKSKQYNDAPMPYSIFFEIRRTQAAAYRPFARMRPFPPCAIESDSLSHGGPFSSLAPRRYMFHHAESLMHEGASGVTRAK